MAELPGGTVVVAVDSSEESAFACELAARLFAHHDAALHLVHVKLDSPLFWGDAVSEADRAKMQEEGGAVLDDRSRDLEEAGAAVAQRQVIIGRRVDEEVVRYCQDVAATALVVGGRGEDERSRRFLLGSVSESLAKNAPCSVLLARR